MTTSITESEVPVRALLLAAMAEEQAKAIDDQGQEAVVFMLLEFSKPFVSMTSIPPLPETTNYKNGSSSTLQTYALPQ